MYIAGIKIIIDDIKIKANNGPNPPILVSGAYKFSNSDL